MFACFMVKILLNCKNYVKCLDQWLETRRGNPLRGSELKNMTRQRKKNKQSHQIIIASKIKLRYSISIIHLSEWRTWIQSNSPRFGRRHEMSVHCHYNQVQESWYFPEQTARK